MPSKRPIGMPNCLRMRAYAPVAKTAERAPPAVFDGSEIARPTERHSTSMRQPCPAMSGPPINCDERDEHILAAHRTVLERHVERKMAASDFKAFGIARQQRQRDAEILDVAEHLLGIVHAKCETDDRRDRRKRDVALVERQAHADHVRAVPFALADDAVSPESRSHPNRRTARSARSTAPRARRRGAAGNSPFVPSYRSARSSSAGPERVRHGYRRNQRRRHAGHLLQHRRMRERRKAEAAVFLRDDHAEEFLLLEEIPDFRREIGAARA